MADGPGHLYPENEVASATWDKLITKEWKQKCNRARSVIVVCKQAKIIRNYQYLVGKNAQETDESKDHMAFWHQLFVYLFREDFKYKSL